MNGRRNPRRGIRTATAVTAKEQAQRTVPALGMDRAASTSENQPSQRVPRTTVSPATTQRLALAGLLALATAIGFVNLWRDWYLDPYFATAVQSMLTGWHTFFFVSFDPAGFISVDKPPLVLWLQAASAKLLGFSTYSLLLPEAIAGVLSVALLYHLLSRAFGPIAGLLAGLMLALTPISVATNRDNNMDSVVVLAVLVGAWMLTIAVEQQRLWPLLLCAMALGLGFNAKLLQAFVVLPAFTLFFLLGSTLTWQTRLIRLGIAALVLIVVSSAWVVIVDSVPASQRPYVGSSSDNTERDLVFGYNGLGRLVPGSTVANAYAGLGSSAGAPSPLRLFDEQLGGQVSWLLPLALIGVLTGIRQNQSAPVQPGRRRGQQPAGPQLDGAMRARRQQSWLLWGSWLLSLSTIYSLANYFHPYNLVMLAPAICALAAICIVTLYQRAPTERDRWVLPAALIATAAVQCAILLESPTWNAWLIPAVALLSSAAALWIYLLGRSPKNKGSGDLRAATMLGVAALLLAPAIWASVPLLHYGNAEFPIAGPDLLNSAIDSPANTRNSLAPATLTRYLLAHHHGERFIMGARFGGIAGPVMLATKQAVLTYGGYLGDDNILDSTQVARLVHTRVIRFFWILPAAGTPSSTAIEGWVKQQCAIVPAQLWQPPGSYHPTGPQLYDCRDALAR